MRLNRARSSRAEPSRQIRTKDKSLLILQINNEENLCWEIYYQAIFRLLWLPHPQTAQQSTYIKAPWNCVQRLFVFYWHVSLWLYLYVCIYKEYKPVNMIHCTSAPRWQNSSDCCYWDSGLPCTEIISWFHILKWVTFLWIRLNWIEHENKSSKPIVISIVITHL